MKTEQETFELWPRFDAFVKIVARRANIRFFNKKDIEKKRTVIKDHVWILARIETGITDRYPSDTLYICQNGRVFPLTDSELCEAMNRLPQKLQQVLILKFGYDYSEQQIAEELKVSVRSCYTRRKKALEELRRLLEEVQHEE